MSSELRTKFLNYMTFQRFSESTKRNYIAAVNGLAKYYGKSPDILTNDQIQNYFLYLLEDKKVSWGTCNSRFSGIICFYRHVVNWEEITFKCPPRKRIRQLPIIMSEEEVMRLFDAATSLKHKTFLKTVYSAGLRTCEVIKLRPEHIESDPSRMMIRVEQGKGRKDRYTILSRRLLPELRKYYLKYRPGEWLFPGHNKKVHITYSGARKIFIKAKKKPI